MRISRKLIVSASVILFFSMLVIPSSAEVETQTLAVSDVEASDQSGSEVKQAKLEAEKRRLARLAEEEKLIKHKEHDQKKKSAQQTKISGDLYQVTGVTDGDTIKISFNGAIETVRFIGMDTPETKDPRKPVQCFGREASSKMQHYVQSRKVRLESDASQGDRDIYGRLLRYVFTEDGRNVAYEMIRGGYAHEYTHSLPYKYQSQFKDAQRYARENSKGLWAPSSCNGVTNQEHPPTPAPAPAPKSTPYTEPAQPSSGGVVKKSRSGICHAPGTTYYKQTKNFTGFTSIGSCLQSGGRLPKR